MEEKRINVKLLREIRAHILSEPRAFNMEVVAERLTAQFVTAALMPPCKTAACIAGDAVLLTDGLPQCIDFNAEMRILRRAAELLGLDVKQSDRLFLSHGWPLPYMRQYNEASRELAGATTDAERLRALKKRARVAAKRITHFIQTNGQE